MRLGGGPSGLGDLDTLEREIHIEGLPAGSYLVEMRDTFGNDAVFPAVNQQPAPLLLRLEPSDFNGFNIACWGGADGTLTALASGGTLPYAFQWSNGWQQPDIGGLSAGQYTVTVLDANDCTVQEYSLKLMPNLNLTPKTVQWARRRVYPVPIACRPKLILAKIPSIRSP